MVLLERLRPQAEIVWALLPIRLLPGSPAPRGWRRVPQFRRIRRDIEVAVVAARGAQRRRRRPVLGPRSWWAVASACGVFFNTEIPGRYLICLGGVAAADTVGLARGQCDAMPREY